MTVAEINPKLKNKQRGKTLDEIRDDHVARYRFAVARLITEDLPGYVLDAGCGVGYGSFILAESGFRVVGVDLDGEAIAHGNAHFTHSLVSRKISDVTKWAGENEPSAVVAFEVIEHVENAPGFLREAGRTAKILIGSVPNEDSIPFEAAKYPWHFRHYTPDEIVRVLTDAGWTLEWIGGQRGKHNGDARMGAAEGSRTIVFVATR